MADGDRDETLSGRVALVTGAARRVGAVIARTLHGAGMDLAIHYRSSRDEALALQAELNAERAESVVLIQSELRCPANLHSLIRQVHASFGGLDVLVNNASVFYPTLVEGTSESHWDEIMETNLKAPFFLAQAAARSLRERGGTIINISDIHADRPLKNHPVYSVSKAALNMLTQSLARELAPHVRVNAIAPGAILWPEHGQDELTRQRILSRIPLKRQGDPSDIARAVLFLVRDAPYVTGQVLAIDGGRVTTS